MGSVTKTSGSSWRPSDDGCPSGTVTVQIRGAGGNGTIGMAGGVGGGGGEFAAKDFTLTDSTFYTYSLDTPGGEASSYFQDMVGSDRDVEAFSGKNGASGGAGGTGGTGTTVYAGGAGGASGSTMGDPGGGGGGAGGSGGVGAAGASSASGSAGGAAGTDPEGLSGAGGAGHTSAATVGANYGGGGGGGGMSGAANGGPAAITFSWADATTDNPCALKLMQEDSGCDEISQDMIPVTMGF